ncbi:pyrroloquinoline quinone biosynthesis peptide chaperone PqqD [Serratia odorifera]|jgi:pyrroloquinoline quinone biosynthesis protein D|uniref:PqqA binding protein n=2 Tax=Serratia odorifera TaxID=618 RepID=D4E6C9_SEROD|nr:pyrroloquinoline quinone biosynthesis peptide chaperone PqqD [Serratia odorifera]EFE94495.1 coenzyme PQQ biosynthesis protein PqqD [Serratia odorifera DSM 4582]MBJ2064883.1 pyrroloquinoline quinone biosynthesis peptide chaperone PqqD [Serratia odorifera]PNK89450.1 pyrroloquinoline quinone biosynthesis peptide chaperone PqqD [Serratia odorifera]RII70306.1 pyrroloquinoline quinone biosynthesis peptide chaperone PqqD [Serratia odorifera]VDZ63312.1 Pyrroloquinoline quinone biosynthesis protein 
MSLRREQTPIFRRGYRLQWEEVQNSHVILYPEGMAKLNESAAMILQLVNGTSTLNQIIDQLNARFPGVPGLADDVLEFFQRAYEQKWVMFRD